MPGVERKKIISQAGVFIALAFILEMLTNFIPKMPQGGKFISLGMIPLIIFSLIHGLKLGILIGIPFGLIYYFLDPFPPLHPLQFIMDYPLAFGLVGVAGFFSSQNRSWKIYPAILLSCFSRFLSHFFSGMIFFSHFFSGIFIFIGSSIFIDQDIIDWQYLMKSLKGHKQAYTKKVWSLLDEKNQSIISSWQPGKPVDEKQKMSIINGLNLILDKRELYDLDSFAGIKLDKECERLLKKGINELKDDELQRLNRLLLESIYPDVIKRSSFISVNVSNPWIYSLLYNGSFIIPTTIVCWIIVPILMKRFRKS